eukprot:gene67816-92915_t
MTGIHHVPLLRAPQAGQAPRCGYAVKTAAHPRLRRRGLAVSLLSPTGDVRWPRQQPHSSRGQGARFSTISLPRTPSGRIARRPLSRRTRSSGGNSTGCETAGLSGRRVPTAIGS